MSFHEDEERPTARRAEGRVVRQLVEALLFERLVPYEARARGAGAWSLAFEPIFDLEITFQLGVRRIRCLGTLSAFDRVRVAHGSVVQLVEGLTEACRLADIVTSLEIAHEAKRRLLDELEQTVTLSRWNLEHLPHQRTPRRALDFQALESAIVEGHPYHPSFKTRTGFSLRDHEQYGFEAGNTFQLEWLGIARASLRSALPEHAGAFWQRELGEATFSALRERLARQGADFRRYALVPIHPWQLRTILAKGLESAIASQEVLLLGSAGDLYQASQSIRTVVNVTDPRRANVKLPLDIVCTSTHRNFEEHFICTAPALSGWLVSLVKEDAFLQARRSPLLLEEYAGIIYETKLDALRGRIGVIYRESVCDKLDEGDAAAPFTALTLVEADGRPFIAEWLERHGVARWVDRLIDVMLVPLWHMLVHHGITFESHAQNLVLVHRDGWPERLVLRDFHQDTEFVPAYLREPQRVPDFAQIDPYFASAPDDDGYRMASTESLRELFMDCVYVYNLADVAFLLRRYFSFSEQTFWSAVRAHLRAYAVSGVTDPDRIAQLASGSPEIIVESLLTKKIKNGAVLDYFEHSIRNTLLT